MNEPRKKAVEPDEWEALKALTDARIALGKTGVSIPLRESLRFRLAHAHAKDAVYSRLDIARLEEDLAPTGLPVYAVHSQAENRDIYLQRPDLGRLLDEPSAKRLQEINSAPADICLIIADGLSATAIHKNAGPVVNLLVEQVRKAGYSLAPIVLVEQGRVAITDAIGEIVAAPAGHYPDWGATRP